MAKIYTGIEFSNTPEDIRYLMSQIAAKLKEQGWFLRTNTVGTFAEEGIKRSSFADGIDMPLFGFYTEDPNNMGEVLSGNIRAKLLGHSSDEPSKFILCYALDEGDLEVFPILCLAEEYHIPVYNLAHKAVLDSILHCLNA